MESEQDLIEKVEGQTMNKDKYYTLVILNLKQVKRHPKNASLILKSIK